MTESRELPVENPNDSRFGRVQDLRVTSKHLNAAQTQQNVIYHVIELEVSMNSRATISPWQIRPNIIHDIVKPRMCTSDQFASLMVFHDSLLRFDTRERITLSGIEVSFLAVTFET